MPSYLGFLSRKKKTTVRTDDTRSQLENAGVSAKDMPTDQERNQKPAPAPEKPKPKPADPNVPADQMGALASQVLEEDRKRKEEIEAARKREAAANKK